MLIFSGMKNRVQTYRSSGSQRRDPLVACRRTGEADSKLRANPTALREPDSKPLPHGLFEIRTVGLIHSRGIYVYQREKTIYLLRVFIKKTKKTPSAEIRLALKRQQEMLDEQEDH